MEFTLVENKKVSGLQTSGDKYKLNNNYTRHYSRLLMSREPELEGFFEVRE